MVLSFVASDLGVSNLSRHIVAIDVRLLQEHVKATLILRQRMAGDLVDETLQPVPAVLDEVLIEEAVVAAERHLAFPRFAGQRRYDNLWVRYSVSVGSRNAAATCRTYFAVAFQFISQPFEVAVAPSDAGLLHLKHGQVCLGREMFHKYNQLCCSLKCKIHRIILELS